VKLQSVEPLHNRGYSIFNQQVGHGTESCQLARYLGTSKKCTSHNFHATFRHELVLSWLKLKVFQVVIKDTRAALLKIINQERQGEHIDQDLVKGRVPKFGRFYCQIIVKILRFSAAGVIEIFIDLGLNNTNLYNTEFEAGSCGGNLISISIFFVGIDFLRTPGATWEEAFLPATSSYFVRQASGPTPRRPVHVNGDRSMSTI